MQKRRIRLSIDSGGMEAGGARPKPPEPAASGISTVWDGQRQSPRAWTAHPLIAAPQGPPSEAKSRLVSSATAAHGDGERVSGIPRGAVNASACQRASR
jgi:hypothetical protein